MQLGNIVHLKKNGKEGSKFPLLEGNECIIGSGLDCNVRIISLGASEPHVCAIKTGKNGRPCIQKLSKSLAVIVNDDEVKGTKSLTSGDIIVLGGRKFTWEATLVTKTPGRIVKKTGIPKLNRRRSLSDFRATVRKSIRYSTAGHLSTWEETNDENLSHKVSSPNKSSSPAKAVAASTSSVLESNIQVSESPLKLIDPSVPLELADSQFGFETKVKSSRKSVKKTKATTPKVTKTKVRSESARKSDSSPLKMSQRCASADKKTKIPQKKYFETIDKVQRPNKKYFATPVKFSPVPKTRRNSPLISKSIFKKSPAKKSETPAKTKSTPIKGRTPLKISPRSAKKTPGKSVLAENTTLSKSAKKTPARIYILTENEANSSPRSAKKTPAKNSVLSENKVKNSPFSPKSSKRTPAKISFSPVKSANKTPNAPKTPQSVKKLPAVKENITPTDSGSSTPENGVKTPDNFILKPPATPQSIKAVKSAVKKDASLRKSLSKQNYSNKRKLSDMNREMGISKKIKLSSPTKDVVIDGDVEYYSGSNKALTEPKRTSKRSKRNSLPSSVDKIAVKGRVSMSNRSTPRNVWSKQRVSTDTPTLHLEESLGNCSPVSRTHHDEIAVNTSFTSINESFNTHKDLSGIERISNDSDLNLIDLSSPKNLRSQKLNTTFSPGSSKGVRSAKKSISLINFASPSPAKDTRMSRSARKNISVVNVEIHTPEPLKALNITSKSHQKTPVQTRTILSDKYENITPEPSRKSLQNDNNLQCEVNLENISMYVQIDENSPTKTFNTSKVAKRMSERVDAGDYSRNAVSDAEIDSPNKSRSSKRFSRFNSSVNNKSLNNSLEISEEEMNASKNNLSRSKRYSNKLDVSRKSSRNNTIDNSMSDSEIMSPNTSMNNVSRTSKRKFNDSRLNQSERDVFSDSEAQNTSRRSPRKLNASQNEDILSDSGIYGQNVSQNNISRTTTRRSQELNASAHTESPIMSPNVSQNASRSSRRFSQKLNTSKTPITSPDTQNVSKSKRSSQIAARDDVIGSPAQNDSINEASRTSKRFSQRLDTSRNTDGIMSPNISQNASTNNVSRSSRFSHAPNEAENPIMSPNVSTTVQNVSTKRYSQKLDASSQNFSPDVFSDGNISQNVSRSSKRFSNRLNATQSESVSPNIGVMTLNNASRSSNRFSRSFGNNTPENSPAPSKYTKIDKKSMSLIDFSSPAPSKSIKRSRSAKKLHNTTFEQTRDSSMESENIIPETPSNAVRKSNRLSQNQTINSSIISLDNMESSFERGNTSNRSPALLNSSIRSIKSTHDLDKSKNDSSQDLITSSSEMSALNISQRSLRKSVLRNATFSKSLAENTFNTSELMSPNTSSTRRSTQNATFRKSMDDCRVDIVNISIDHISVESSNDGNVSRRTTRSLKIDTSVETSDLDNTDSMSLHYDSTSLDDSVDKVEGTKAIFNTSKQLKSPLNDLREVKGLRNLFKTPNRVAKSPKNDLTEIKGVKKMFKTPKRQRSPENNLEDVKGIKKLMKTPKQHNNSPKNDLSDLRGVKQLVEGYEKSPRNDLTDIPGVKRFLRTPKIALSPKNDLSNVKGVQKLFSSGKKPAKSPKNDLTDVGGVKRMFGEASTSNSYLNVSSMDVLFDELKDNANNPADDSFKIVEKLKRSPVRTYERKAKSVSPLKTEKPIKTRASVYTTDKEPADIAKWIEEQKSFTKNKTVDNGETKENVNEVKSNRISGDHLLDDKIPPTNDPELLFVEKRPINVKRDVNLATEDESETPTKRESRRKQKTVKDEPQTPSSPVKPKVIEETETKPTNKRTRNRKIEEVASDSPSRTRRTNKEVQITDEVVASPRTRRGETTAKPETPITIPIKRRGRPKKVEIVETITVQKTTRRVKGAKNTIYTETLEVLESTGEEPPPEFAEESIVIDSESDTDEAFVDVKKNKKHVTFVMVADMKTPVKATRSRRGAKEAETEPKTQSGRGKRTKVEKEPVKRATRGKKTVDETNEIEEESTGGKETGDETNEEDDVVISAPVKKGRATRGKKVVEERIEEDDVVITAPVKRTRATRGKKTVEETQTSEEAGTVAVKKVRATKGKKIVEEEEEQVVVRATRGKKVQQDEEEVVVEKKSTRGRKAKVETEAKVTKSKRGKNVSEETPIKTTRAKKVVEDESEAETEEKPKSTRGKRTKTDEEEVKATTRRRKVDVEPAEVEEASPKRQKAEDAAPEKPKAKSRARKAQLKEEEPIRKSARTRKAK